MVLGLLFAIGAFLSTGNDAVAGQWAIIGGAIGFAVAIALARRSQAPARPVHTFIGGATGAVIAGTAAWLSAGVTIGFAVGASVFPSLLWAAAGAAVHYGFFAPRPHV